MDISIVAQFLTFLIKNKIMYRKILARYFDEQEVYLIGSAIDLINSKEEVNVNMAYNALQSLGLLRRLLDVLSEYYKDITFVEYGKIGAKYIVINDVEETITPTDTSIHLTYQDFIILSYSFLDYLAIGCTRSYPYIELCSYFKGSNYYGIPAPMFPTNLTLRGGDDPIGEFSFLDGELFNIPITDSVFKFAGGTPPKLPTMNIQSNMRIELFSSLHIAEVIKETFQYPLMQELTLVVYDEIPIDRLLKIQLPHNLKTFDLYISCLYKLIIPQAFFKNILSTSKSLAKFKFSENVELTDGSISILEEYGYRYEHGVWIRD